LKRFPAYTLSTLLEESEDLLWLVKLADYGDTEGGETGYAE
jgi:hypothetical protein